MDDLDVTIAIKVMGELPYEIWYLNAGVLVSQHPDGLTYSCQSKEQAEEYRKDFPYETRVMKPYAKAYSSDIAAAWEIVDKMQSLGKTTHIESDNAHPPNEEWRCAFRPFIMLMLKSGLNGKTARH